MISILKKTTFLKKTTGRRGFILCLAAFMFLTSYLAPCAEEDGAKYAGKTFWGISSDNVAASTVPGLEKFPGDMRVLKVKVVRAEA